RIHPVDRVHPGQRTVLVLTGTATAARRPLVGVDRGSRGPGDLVTGAQAISLDRSHGHVDVLGLGNVPRGAHEGVVVDEVDGAGNRHVGWRCVVAQGVPPRELGPHHADLGETY